MRKDEKGKKERSDKMSPQFKKDSIERFRPEGGRRRSDALLLRRIISPEAVIVKAVSDRTSQRV